MPFKNFLIIFLVLLAGRSISAQTSCSEMLQYVTSNSYGSTLYSYDSEAITSVTFYDLSIDYDTYYFAVVQFTSSYQKYIYQVGSQTEINYRMDYFDSAGKAFWKHIQPYADALGCGPSF